MRSISELNNKLFDDSADKSQILEAQADPLIRGFTTNSTLVPTTGVTDFETFTYDILEAYNDKPISFGVFADEFEQMARRADKIAGWADNVLREDSGHEYPPRVICEPDSASSVFANRVKCYRHTHAAAGVRRGDCAVSRRAVAGLGGCGTDCRRRARIVASEPVWAPEHLPGELCCLHIITATDGVLSKLKVVERTCLSIRSGQHRCSTTMQPIQDTSSNQMRNLSC